MKYVIRVSIRQTGMQQAGLTIYGKTQKEAVTFIQRVIDEQHLSWFTKSKVTSKGLTPVETRDLLKAHLDQPSQKVSEG